MEHTATIRAILLAVLLSLVCNGNFCYVPDPKYSGEWLATELDMDTPEKVNQAMGLENLKNKEPQVSNSQAAPFGFGESQKTGYSYVDLVDSGNYQETIASINEQLRQAENMDESQKFNLVLNKLVVLIIANKYVDALVEAQRWLDRVNKAGTCHPKSPNNHICMLMKKFITQTDADLSHLDSYRILQLSPGASAADIKKSYRNMLLMVHPDKYTDMDETAQSFMYKLYFKHFRNDHIKLLMYEYRFVKE